MALSDILKAGLKPIHTGLKSRLIQNSAELLHDFLLDPTGTRQKTLRIKALKGSLPEGCTVGEPELLPPPTSGRD